MPKKPCKECVFRRDSSPGEMGGSPPGTYIGQSEGPFWIPCHLSTNYDDPNWKSDLKKPQCAGAATYRANLGIDHKMPDFLERRQPDHEAVFSEHREFLAHHCQIPIDQAELDLKKMTPRDLLLVEMKRAGVKVHMIAIPD